MALGIGIFLGLALGFLYFIDPASSGVFPPCPFHWLTGWHCPGCGSLRATHHLLRGNLGAAFCMNPLLLIALPVICLMLLYPRWTYAKWVPWAAFTILIAYGIARNIPIWPFTLLSPH